MTEMDINNLNGIERVLRLFVGCALIGSVMLSPFTFEYLVLMPLIGIYPCLTAILGWDPIYFALDVNRPKVDKLIQDHLVPSSSNTDLLTPRAI